MGKKIPDFDEWSKYFIKKRGLEIGGPSGQFFKNGYFPVYPHLEQLDGVNFNSNTVWEGFIKEGKNFKFEDRTGFQFLAEATDLKQVENESYQIVMSCNNLEHIANPLKAINEWKRVLENNGSILLVVPNKLSNFDHKRPYTTFEHIEQDFKNNINEDDLTHLEEVLTCHDLRRDAQAVNYHNFKKRSLNNLQNRCMHHHVYNMDLLQKMLHACGFTVEKTYSSLTDHYILGKKI